MMLREVCFVNFSVEHERVLPRVGLVVSGLYSFLFLSLPLLYITRERDVTQCITCDCEERERDHKKKRGRERTWQIFIHKRVRTDLLYIIVYLIVHRAEINILLCGDPGTSKSQLLQYVHKIAPRGIYTSGKGSSAVGLTAYITKDPDTGEAVLERFVGSVH
jgi:hypothetical protein